MASSGQDDEEFMAWLRKSCEEQGVPLVLADPLALEQVAVLLGKSPAKRPHTRRDRLAA